MNVVLASDLSPAARRTAVALLRDAGFLEFFPGLGLPEHLYADFLVAIGPDDAVRAAIFLERMEGACATVWGPAWRTPPLPAERQILLDAVKARLRTFAVRVLQALQPVGAPREELEALGLSYATRIWTMRREADAPLPILDSPDLEFVPQGNIISDDFRRTLLDTFIDSLDCPEWNGLRDADEILAAHFASAPDLERWWLVRSGEAPVGVVILADGEAADHVELSYTGVAPKWRRRGVLKSMLRFAIVTAGTASLHLLVDARNRHAWMTYLAFGFRQTRERELYIGQLHPN